jgi:hypothetical protein
MHQKRAIPAKKKPASTALIKPRWTKEQIALLKRLHKSCSNVEIAQVLGRPAQSVAYKAHRLGLRKGARRLRKMGQENIRHRWGE